MKPGRSLQGRDWGETEAIQQAVELGAILLADDLWARGIAARMGLRCMGTIGVLDRLLELRIVTQPDARSAVRRILDAGIRLPEDELCRRDWL